MNGCSWEQMNISTWNIAHHYVVVVTQLDDGLGHIAHSARHALRHSYRIFAIVTGGVFSINSRIHKFFDR